MAHILSVMQPVPLDPKKSYGITGFVLPDPVCIPGATFDSPLPSLPDIYNDQSISAVFSFPPQSSPHQSLLLPGVKRSQMILNSYDKDTVRRGGGERPESNGFHSQNRNQDRGPGFAKLDNRGRGGAYNNNSPENRGNYQAGNGSNGGGAYSGYDSRGSNGGGYSGQQQQQQRGPSTNYGYGAPSGGVGGYRPPAPPANAYNNYAGPVAPPVSRYSAGPQLYGMGNLGAPQGQYGYNNPPPAARGPPRPGQGAGGPPAVPPPFSGYGGYGGNGSANKPPPPRRY